MKIVIINGSARKGNTLSAVNALASGAGENNEVKVITADQVKIAPCKGCEACECYKGCVDDDDTNGVVDTIAGADLIVFASPVYWWGITAQIKQVIDKCYCRGAQLKGKKVGTIVIGGASTDDIQYELIDKQFECMAQYLEWNFVFQKSYSASAADDLEKDHKIIDQLKELGKTL